MSSLEVPRMVTTTRAAPHVAPGLLGELAARVPVAVGRPAMGIMTPFTETEIGVVSQARPDDVRAAVQRARVAQATWARFPVRERARILSRFHDLLIERADTAMDLVQLAAGKARIPAFEEVYDTIATTRYYLKTGPPLLSRKRRSVSMRLATVAYECRHPLGVVGSISPWNFPFTLAISDIVPALLAGNTVVCKPDEKTPFSALYGGSLLEEAGLPPGVFQVVTGPGPEIGPVLIDEVDFLMFTGSTEVGRQVAARAGERLIGASLELGGKPGRGDRLPTGGGHGRSQRRLCRRMVEL